MTLSPYEILETLVERFGEEETPVAPESLAERLGVDPDEIRDQLAVLRSHELIAETEDGEVGPTVTGRELLGLDVADDDFVIIETRDDWDEDETS